LVDRLVNREQKPGAPDILSWRITFNSTPFQSIAIDPDIKMASGRMRARVPRSIAITALTNHKINSMLCVCSKPVTIVTLSRCVSRYHRLKLKTVPFKSMRIVCATSTNLAITTQSRNGFIQISAASVPQPISISPLEIQNGSYSIQFIAV
jgi:hypothetical protein